MDSNSIKTQFYTWLSGKVSSKVLSDLYIRIDDIDSHCIKNGITTTPLLETNNLSTILKVRTTISQNKSFILKHRKHAREYVAIVDYYYEFIKDHYHPDTSQSIVNQEAETINSQISEKEHNTINVSTKDIKHKNNSQSDFSEWLINNQRLSVSTARNYSTGICVCESFMKEHSIGTGHLYSASTEEVTSNIETLFADKQFQELNAIQHNRLSASLNKYSSFRETTISPNNIVSRENPKMKTLEETSHKSLEKDITKAFIEWMHKERHIAVSTARLYASSITWCENYMRLHHIGTGQLYISTRNEAKTNIEKLLKDQEFVKENSEQRYRYFASLKKLIEYRELGSIVFPMRNKPCTNEMLVLAKVSKKQQKKEYNSETINNVSAVLEKHYQYGFKRDSIREILRFRQFADSLCLSIPDNDEQLVEAIELVGETIDDKVYYKKGNLNNELLKLVKSVFEQGVKIIYYESFYTINAEWMEKNFITSESVLKEYLEKAVPDCSFSKKFMTNGIKETEKVAITEEIKRVWGNKQILEVDELSKKLPYIPLNNIWRVVSGNDSFVLAYEGAYLNIDFLIISQAEKDEIVEYVKNACYEKGFVSLLEIPIESIEEENYDIPKSAIFRAIYNIALSDEYHLNGKILTKDNPDLDAVSLLKQRIKGKDTCTFEETLETLIDLTSVSNRQYVFQALYDEMIRVDKNRFVADSNVHFSVDEIDKVLSVFMENHFCSIQDITTFAMFPVCGQTWNHYLLESFCYKYSKKYNLHIKNFNDKNAGIIAEKDYLKNYDEMLAIVIAKSNIELTVEAIGQYLYENGFMAKRKYAKYPVIIQRALDLRKSR